MTGRSRLVKHSVRIAGHATSVSLEGIFWAGMCEIAARRQLSVNALLAVIDADRDGNLSSAIRLFVLDGCRRGELAGWNEDDGKEPADPTIAPGPGNTHVEW